MALFLLNDGALDGCWALAAHLLQLLCGLYMFVVDAVYKKVKKGPEKKK